MARSEILRPWYDLPPAVADVLRAELPGVAQEIIEAVRVEVPPYARRLEGPFGRGLIAGVEQALRQFADGMGSGKLPRARVFHASPSDRSLLREERIGAAQVAVAALGDDARSLYAAVAGRTAGIHTTIAVVDDPTSLRIFEQAGVDVTVNPRAATAQQLVRFAHDPRTRQVAFLDDDRFDVLDITVRPDGELLGRPLRELPRTGSTIGAIVRDGSAIFPHGDSVLRPGDRAIVLVDPLRAAQVEAAL